jgi:uncharacterized membrane protein
MPAGFRRCLRIFSGHSSRSSREIALWLATACVLVTGIGFSWNPTPFAQALAAVFIACALVHAGFFYGSRPALVLFFICIAITFAVENIGATTGFPFGHYHFDADLGLPRLGSIPVIVGPLWFIIEVRVNDHTISFVIAPLAAP